METELALAKKACLHLQRYVEKQPDRTVGSDIMTGVVWLSTTLATQIHSGAPLTRINEVSDIIKNMTLNLLEEVKIVEKNLRM